MALRIGIIGQVAAIAGRNGALLMRKALADGAPEVRLSKEERSATEIYPLHFAPVRLLGVSRVQNEHIELSARS